MKRPRIETNEGPPHKFVQIASTVVARPDSTYPIVIKPYKLDISQFSDKVRKEMTFNITNVSEEALDITLIDRPEGLFDVKLPDQIGAGETAEGTLTVRDDAIDEEFEKSITIELSDEAKSRFTIPVKRTLRMPGQATAAGSK